MVAEKNSAAVDKMPNGSGSDHQIPKGRCSCKVVLLDGSEFEIIVDKTAKGSELFEKVTQRLDLWEKDYFGLSYRDSAKSRMWLNCDKRIAKQMKGQPCIFWFAVKFYPPEPNQLQEDITRYHLCLQVQKDVVSGRLPCSFVTYALLGSYMIQAQIGDYDRVDHSRGASEDDYLLDYRFAPYQSTELLYKVCELHKAHKGMSSEESESRYLEISKTLALYGVDMHQAKDLEGAEVSLGVCSSGLLVYKDHLRVNRFAWTKILKISFRRTHFYIKIRPGGFEQRDTTVGFRLENYKAAERLWKCCVEQHTFFRLMSPEPPPKKGFIRMGASVFRFSGRTHYQARLASALIDRPQQRFQRSQSARFAQRPVSGGTHVKDEMKTSSMSDGSGPLHYYVRSSPRGDESHAAVDNALRVSDQLPLPVYSLKRDTDVSLVEYALPANVLTPPHKEYYIIAPQKSPSSVEMDRSRGSSSAPNTARKPAATSSSSTTANSISARGEEPSTPQWCCSSPRDAVGPIFEQVHPSKSGLVEKLNQQPKLSPRASPTEKRLSSPNDKAVMEQVERVIEQGPTNVERVVGADGITVTTTSCSQVRTDKRIVQRETVETFAPMGNGGGENAYPSEYDEPVERNIDVYSDGDIDHDAELTAAILEATKMDPSYTVEKIEVKRHAGHQH